MTALSPSGSQIDHAARARYWQGRKPRIFGHRGAAGVLPENTLPSFAAALAAGATHLELDVHATKDGHVVVLHDPDAGRTTGVAGEVRRMTLAEARALDASACFEVLAGFEAAPFEGPLQIPTLAEVLDAFPEARLNIDIKQADPPIEALVVDLLRSRGALDRTLLTSESDEVVAKVRALAPDAITGCAAGEVMVFVQGVAQGGGAAPAGRALQVPVEFHGFPIVTAPFVERAHALGIEVHVWTIDDPAEMDRLVALGVDGIITNVPHVAAARLPRGD
jgi:glycerophosphoryl diester phosphodiesterase